MLELTDLTLTIGQGDSAQTLLNEISLRLPRGHFAAIIGPSGCGKSTLLKAIAGIREHTGGGVHWEGRDLAEQGDMAPHEIGYVPQFSIAHDLLTVEESVEGALRLRVAVPEDPDAAIEKVLKATGLRDIADRRVSLLSGGQKRRLAMAMEMVSSPHLLLCDEVTSGLDPKSEDEIVKLMHELAGSDRRIVLSVTHSLQHVREYDSIIVLYQGRLVYHGAPDFITHYFGIERPEDLYPRLTERKAEEWHRSWQKYRATYYQQSNLPAAPEKPAAPAPTEPAPGKSEAKTEPAKAEEPLDEQAELERLRAIVEGKHQAERKPEPEKKRTAPLATAETPSVLPGFFTQFGVLVARRWKLFLRDRGQLLLHAALLFGFPFLVVVFAFDGLPQVQSLSSSGIGTLFSQAQQEARALKQIASVGTLVSGLIMFQVILLALMGSNNSAREIAAERLLFEKEKFAGLSPVAYVASKVVFLGVLVLAQSIWMAVFVNWIVGFQGSFVEQVFSLILINAALTSICLGISAWVKTPEQSSLLSIYLVGFQLPLSGAVLALPKAIAGFTQIFIASYWSWSGFIRSMENTHYYDAVKSVTQTEPAGGLLCVWVLTAHVVLGLFLAYTGSRNSRWE